MSPIFFAKHFNILARSLARTRLDDEMLDLIIDELGKLFIADNDRFSFERFKRAVYRIRNDGGH
jgi:hypothetical protein